MNMWWNIHTATLDQLCWRWTRDYIYIPQLYINFSADKHLMIYTYRNFISIFLQLYTWWYIHTATLFFQQMNTWWYIHTATLDQLFFRWTPDDIDIPQLYINFAAEKHLMVYTYRNFVSTFLQIKSAWYIHTATLYKFSYGWTLCDIYTLQPYVNFPANEHLMIYTYWNFIWTFLQIITWWYMDTATLYQFSCSWTPDDIYIRQLYINFPADEYVMIYTYCNFISTFLEMNTGLYIHTATWYQLSCRWIRDDIYILQLYINFPADKHVMIYTYRNFIWTLLQMNTWWYIHTVTLHQFSCRWTRDDIYIPQLYINFSANKHLMIYTCRNFISIFQ